MPTVLLVEDDRDVLETLEAVLVQDGNRVIGAGDAPAALSAIRDGARVDVIVTDYKLPKMDGLEFLGALRDITPGTPVIVLTGYSTIDNYLKCMNLGAYDCINKPVLSREFKRIVRAAALNGEIRRTGRGVVLPGPGSDAVNS